MTRRPRAGLVLAALLWAASARANSIASIVVERNGDVYFSDYVRDKIWKVDGRGALTVALANRHSYHLVLDSGGAIYGENRPARGGDVTIWRLEPGGSAQEVFRPARYGRTASYRGTVFTIDRQGNLLYLRDCQVVRLGEDGGLTALTPHGCRETAWSDPLIVYGHLHGSLAWGPDGALYFSDGRSIRRIGPDGSVTTLDGRPTSLFAGHQPDEPRYESLMGLAVDDRGNVYAADKDSRSILRFHTDGRTDVVARLGMFWSPTALALSGSTIYVLVNLRFPTPGFLSGVFGNPTLQKLSADGRITTVSTVKPRLR